MKIPIETREDCPKTEIYIRSSEVEYRKWYDGDPWFAIETINGETRLVQHSGPPPEGTIMMPLLLPPVAYHTPKANGIITDLADPDLEGED